MLPSHSYQQLPLIPLEEYLERFPEHTEDDEKTLMLARINNERVEREELEEQRQELLKRRKALIADNEKSKDGLARLDKDLQNFLDVGLPEIPKSPRNFTLTCCRVQNQSSRHLRSTHKYPRPRIQVIRQRYLDSRSI